MRQFCNILSHWWILGYIFIIYLLRNFYYSAYLTALSALQLKTEKTRKVVATLKIDYKNNS